jgi:exopolysaccharide biosynthesis predicted pyruvyltransferase EpsI
MASYLTGKLLASHATPTLADVQRALRSDRIAQDLLRRTAGSNHLNAFRCDGEATDIALPPDNIDLSIELQFGVESPAIAEHCARTLLGVLERFESVSTNRLHVAISAALISRRVLFYPNNYYKCKGVYEYSLRQRFPNVTWMGS